jgi:hypothetical protein
VNEAVTLWKASLETRNFSFEAYGKSRWAARNALIRGLLRHAQEYQIPDIWWSPYRDDIVFNCIGSGVAYRDGEALRKVEYNR